MIDQIIIDLGDKPHYKHFADGGLEKISSGTFLFLVELIHTDGTNDST